MKKQRTFWVLFFGLTTALSSFSAEISAANESKFYAGPLLGFSFQTSSGFDSKMSLDYGARFGVIGNALDDLGRLSAGLSYDRYSFEDSGVDFGFSNLMIQLLFQRIGNSGFYAGPELGVGILDLGGGIADRSDHFFEIGILVGYEHFLNPSFSIGPEIHYDHNGDASDDTTFLIVSSNVLKVLFGGTFHF